MRVSSATILDPSALYKRRGFPEVLRGQVSPMKSMSPSPRTGNSPLLGFKSQRPMTAVTDLGDRPLITRTNILDIERRPAVLKRPHRTLSLIRGQNQDVAQRVRSPEYIAYPKAALHRSRDP